MHNQKVRAEGKAIKWGTANSECGKERKKYFTSDIFDMSLQEKHMFN